MSSRVSRSTKTVVIALALISMAGLAGLHFNRNRGEADAPLSPLASGPHVPANGSPSSRQARAEPLLSGPIKRIGAKAFLVEGNLLAPEGDAVDVIRMLEGPARNGDGHAALMITLKLMNCRHAIGAKDDDELLLIEAQILGGIDAALQEREAALARCNGISTQDLATIGPWLQRAADSGNVNAQLLYAHASNLVLISPGEMIRSPQRIVDYKANALRYLQQAASQGSLNALWRLGNAYSTGNLIERDDARAYAYYLAAMKDGGIEKLPEVEALEASLSSQQRHDAALLAKEIYRDCCEID